MWHDMHVTANLISLQDEDIAAINYYILEVYVTA